MNKKIYLLFFIIIILVIFSFFRLQFKKENIPIPEQSPIVNDNEFPKFDVIVSAPSVDGISMIHFESQKIEDRKNTPQPRDEGINTENIIHLAIGDGTETISTGMFDVCDISFERITNIITPTNHLQLYLATNLGTIPENTQKIIKENPTYFKKDEKNCGGNLMWKDNQAFIKDLVSGKTGPISQKWYKTFDYVISKISKATTDREIGNIIQSLALESSDQNEFKFQPGTIKSIKKQADETWVFTIDLLSPNYDFAPGADGIQGKFFLNNSPKLRNLIADKMTKTYACGGNPINNNTSAELLELTESYINKLQDNVAKYDLEYNEAGEKATNVNAFFDSNGKNITAIYTQCLP